MTIAGLSGSGKSLICEQLKRDFVDCNPNENFDILSFEFEMLSKDQVARNLSGKLNLSTKYLYSGEDNMIDDEEFERIKSASSFLKNYPIYYVDEIGTVNDISKTILKFINDHELLSRKRGLIITIDHVLLTKGKQGEAEKSIIDDLAHTCVALKKLLDSAGLRVLIILLSQLNRNIESSERVLNPMLHYPTKNDIFGASSLYHSSDYVLITHKPAIIDGIKEYYGPPKGPFTKGLPVYNPANTEQPMVYWHLIKERFGNPKILMMLDEFKNSKVSEFTRN